MQMTAVDITMMAFMGGILLIASIAILGGFLHSRRHQQLAHEERMKALELGREVPDDQATARVKAVSETGREKSYAGKCFSTTGQACFWGFLFALGAASKDWGEAPGAAYAIAAAAGAVGVTGLICGTILASRSPVPAEAPVKARYDHDGL